MKCKIAHLSCMSNIFWNQTHIMVCRLRAEMNASFISLRGCTVCVDGLNCMIESQKTTKGVHEALHVLNSNMEQTQISA